MVAVWVIISLYIELIVLFVDGTVSSAIYYRILYCILKCHIY